MTLLSCCLLLVGFGSLLGLGPKTEVLLAGPWLLLVRAPVRCFAFLCTILLVSGPSGCFFIHISLADLEVQQMDSVA